MPKTTVTITLDERDLTEVVAALRHGASVVEDYNEPDDDDALRRARVLRDISYQFATKITDPNDDRRIEAERILDARRKGLI